MRQKTQGPSHIPIAEGKLPLRCWWKVGSNLQSNTGNQLSSWDDMRCMELSSSCCTDINIHIDLRWFSQGLSGVLSRKSSLLTCLIGYTILLCTKCREIKPHLPARGRCHGISRVAAGTWGIFSSYSADGHSKLHLVQRSQDSCVVMTDTSGI